MEEIWKDVVGYEGLYEVSNYGRVRSLHFRTTTEKYFIQIRVGGAGYCKCTLCRNREKDTIEVHRLVAMAFMDNPFNLPCVNHKDEDKTNNFVYVNPDGTVDVDKSNLEWCTYSYNNKYGKGNKQRTESKKNTWKKKKGLAA
jgi:hypothetical protein